MTTRTFHPRQGRVSARHRDALADLWPRYGLRAAGPIDATALYGRAVPLVLEIGSGMGEATAELAARQPEHGFIAVEIHRPGLANLLTLVDELGLTNVRVANGDALALLREQVPSGSLSAVHAFFPDPWPKLRHHKRRLFVPDRIALIVDRLRPGGVLRCATDDAGYARMMLKHLTAHPRLVNPYDGFAPRPADRPVTRFEQRALSAGRPVFDLMVRRVS